MTKITEAEYDFVMGWDGNPNRDVDLIVNNMFLSFIPHAVELGLFYRVSYNPIMRKEVGVLEASGIKVSSDDEFFDLLAEAAIVESISEQVGVPAVMIIPEYSKKLGVLIDTMETMLPKHTILFDNRDEHTETQIIFEEETGGVGSGGSICGPGVSRTKAMIVTLMEIYGGISGLIPE